MRTVRAEGAEEEAGRRRLPRAGVAGEDDVQAALEKTGVAAALHVGDLGVELGQEGLEGSHPDELAHLSRRRGTRGVRDGGHVLLA